MKKIYFKAPVLLILSLLAIYLEVFSAYATEPMTVDKWFWKADAASRAGDHKLAIEAYLPIALVR